MGLQWVLSDATHVSSYAIHWLPGIQVHLCLPSARRTYKENGVNISIRINHHVLLLFKIKENEFNQF